MASRGRGRRGGGRGNNQPPPAFDQQAFMEAISAAAATIVQTNVVATTIAQASANVGQGGLSNLQKFKAHHPPTFKGGGELMEADHWFRQVGKISEAVDITSDATRIRLATFQLKGESQVWWDWVKALRNLETITWEEFRELFMGKYVTVLESKQGVPRVETRNDDGA